MGQVFYADMSRPQEYPNGAIGYAPGGPMDCLGPFAKVRNCPIVIGLGDEKREVARLTCYATGYADTWFSVPANTRYRGHRVIGYFTNEETGIEFRVVDSCKHLFEGPPA